MKGVNIIRIKGVSRGRFRAAPRLSPGYGNLKLKFNKPQKMQKRVQTVIRYMARTEMAKSGFLTA